VLLTVTVACRGSQSKATIKYFVGFVELPCLSAALGNVSQYKVCLVVFVSAFYSIQLCLFALLPGGFYASARL